MKLEELKKEIQKYQYFEDTKIIDVAIASIIATRLQIGDPVWLVIIGASSGGKSQILRPLSLTDKKFIHRIDDLTENTFLSGMKAKKDEKISLLDRIGKKGIVVISDLTVLFSKASETRATILSQFRMLYDGEMTKHSGNSSEPLHWKGYLGVVAGSTPSIYSHFEEVSDMGERFIYYRMKDYSPEKATQLALSRQKTGKELDDTLAENYDQYIKDICIENEGVTFDLSDTVKDRITEVAMFAERVRTIAHVNKFNDEINRIPVSAMPMRVALQLQSIAKALTMIRKHESGTSDLNDEDLGIIDWCGYSLANEEKRACLKTLASVEFENELTTSTIADKIGLSTSITKNFLQNLASVGVLNRRGDIQTLSWSFKNQKDYDIVRRIEHIKETQHIENRQTSIEEQQDYNETEDNEIPF